MSILYNTTQFSRFYTMISIGIPDDKRTKPRKIRITFNEEEIIINPEDVDPSVGRFRNMVESTIIPKKRPRNDMGKKSTYIYFILGQRFKKTFLQKFEWLVGRPCLH